VIFGTETIRQLVCDPLGRRVIEKIEQRKKAGFITLTYQSRALEWINIRKVLEEMLIEFGFESLVESVHDIGIAWRYHDNIATVFYKPAFVFKLFSFLELFDVNNVCKCLQVRRFAEFLDPLTESESSKYAPASVHVRSTNVNLIQNRQLREAMKQGLNHIPLKPTKLNLCISTIMDAFDQLCSMLGLEDLEFPVNEAREWLRDTSLTRLKEAQKLNRFGFRVSSVDLLSVKAVQDEIAWITKNLFCSGLDKASNNCCFLCIRHIRLMAVERFSGSDF